MDNISNKIISIEEARTALKCMAKCGLSPDESIESIDEVADRIRTVNTSYLVREAIDTKLTPTQKSIVTDYWFNGKSIKEIADLNGISQNSVYKALSRAHKKIEEYLSPVIRYHYDLKETEIIPLYVDEMIKIFSASQKSPDSLFVLLKKIRLENGISVEKCAKAVGIPQKDLIQIEKGTISPKASLINKYSILFNRSITIKFEKGYETIICKNL